MRKTQWHRGWAWLLVLSLLAALGAAGCGGGGGSGSGGGNTSPEITLSDLALAFGKLVANQTADRSVTVRNDGTGDLNIGQVSTPAAPFAIAADTCSNSALGPADVCTITVRFSPTSQAVYASSFSVPSDDADEASVTVDLTGTGMGLNVSISSVDLSCPAPTVKVTVTVTDSNNDPLTTLGQANFAVDQNGAAVAIDNFLGLTAAVPVSVAMTLDYSNSLQPFLATVEQEAKDFIDLLGAADSAAVYKFAAQVETEADFTLADNAGKTLLKAAIDDPFSLATRPTKLFDSVDFVLTQIAGQPNERRAIVLLTDGFDNDSNVSLQGLIDNARSDGVFIFTIGIGTVETEVLQRLARETGGLYFYTPDETGLAAIYAKISEVLTNQYQFEYTNPAPDDPGNVLEVQVDNGGGLSGDASLTLPNC